MTRPSLSRQRQLARTSEGQPGEGGLGGLRRHRHPEHEEGGEGGAGAGITCQGADGRHTVTPFESGRRNRTPPCTEGVAGEMRRHEIGSQAVDQRGIHRSI